MCICDLLFEGGFKPDIQGEESLAEIQEEVDSTEKIKLDLPSNIIKNKDDALLPQIDVKGKSSSGEISHCFQHQL